MIDLPIDISRKAYDALSEDHRQKIANVFKALHIASRVLDFHSSKPCFSATIQLDIEIRNLSAMPAYEFVKFNDQAGRRECLEL